ncbi:hypothetical protein AAG906_035655 [Vitis piasezkii]
MIIGAIQSNHSLLVLLSIYLSTAMAVANMNSWGGTTILLPLLGAFVADSYLGQYRTIVLASLLYILVGLSLSLIHCPTIPWLWSDRFDGQNLEECKSKSSFFNLWLLGVSTGTSVTYLIVSYIEDNFNWGLGFGIPCIVMVAALLVFLLGTRTYWFTIKGNGESPFVRIGKRMRLDSSRFVQLLKRGLGLLAMSVLPSPSPSNAKNSFFNWWYFSMCFGTLITLFVLNYIQDNLNWGLGFGIPCIAMVIALLVFLLGTKTYCRNGGEDERIKTHENEKYRELESCILELPMRLKKHACLFGSPKFPPEMELSDMTRRQSCRTPTPLLLTENDVMSGVAVHCCCKLVLVRGSTLTHSLQVRKPIHHLPSLFGVVFPFF